MKVIKVKYIPFKFTGITIYPFIFFLKGRNINNTLVRHETIHLRQQSEMLLIFFYLFYAIEFIVKLINQRNFYNAYLTLSFEREAYRNSHNDKYLKNRKRFAWLKYIYEKDIIDVQC